MDYRQKDKEERALKEKLEQERERLL